MTIWVSYNCYGDMITDGVSYAEAMNSALDAGYYEDEIVVLRVSA